MILSYCSWPRHCCHDSLCDRHIAYKPRCIDHCYSETGCQGKLHTHKQTDNIMYRPKYHNRHYNRLGLVIKSSWCWVRGLVPRSCIDLDVSAANVAHVISRCLLRSAWMTSSPTSHFASVSQFSVAMVRVIGLHDLFYHCLAVKSMQIKTLKILCQIALKI